MELTNAVSGETGGGAKTRDTHPLLLEVRDLSYSFGETRALRAATLSIANGEIRALAGENGSGKTTLIKVLSGVLHPAAGELRWEGQPIRFSRPKDALRAGVATVFQETLIASELSVRHNIFMGSDGLFRRAHTTSAEYEQAERVLAELGLVNVDLDLPLWTLSLAERQLVTIARSIVRPWRLLVLDEATSALDAHQRDRLFDYLRAERAKGKSVLFTSHRMDEVSSLADSVAVLRLGGTVAQSRMADTSPRQILAQMAGAELQQAEAAVEARRQRSRAQRPETAVVRLQSIDLKLRRDSEPVSIGVAPGEILGLAGLEGQGQVEFAEAICGLGRHVSGQVTVLDAAGASHALRRSGDAKRHGVAYVPRDRKQEGLFFPLSILDNFGVSMFGELNTLGVIRRGAIKTRLAVERERLRLTPRRSADLVGVLSGGNQQKVLLGRWLATDPRVLVLNDPLRGVDANTKEELYAVFRDLADEGMAIVLVSTEIIELLTLSDRIAVFHGGEVHTVLTAEDATEGQVIAAMFGERSEADR
jgi:ABC-type sugar transport system ATPase subunit